MRLLTLCNLLLNNMMLKGLLTFENFSISCVCETVHIVFPLISSGITSCRGAAVMPLIIKEPN